MTFCLPQKYADPLLDALRLGQKSALKGEHLGLQPDILSKMTSVDRKAAFAKYIGEDISEEVNSLFESKLLLHDQRAGMRNWVNQLIGLNEDTRKTIDDQINSLRRILNPTEEKNFLASLAAKKLGAEVTASEAKEIFSLSQKAREAKKEMLADMNDHDYRTATKDMKMSFNTFKNPVGPMIKRINYARAIMDLNDKVESFKPGGQSFASHVLDVLSLPKSMLTSIGHLSAPFVQGWGMIGTKNWYQGFAQMMRFFGDEEAYNNLNAYIISHPDYTISKEAGLGLTDLSDRLSTREEAIQSTLVEKANNFISDKTGAPNLVRASSRAFTGYLNYVKFTRYTDLLNAARMAGEDIRVGSSVTRDIADAINNFTGRGNIGIDDNLKNVAPVLNAVFFAPRKISATIQMFNPIEYLKPQSQVARMAKIRQLSGSILATGAVLGLARAMGADVDIDPRSSDFMKIQIGKEKLDITGGNAVYTRLLGRLITGTEITSKGKIIELGEGYKPVTKADIVEQYFRGKLSPVAGVLADALYGTDPIGRPFNMTTEARDKLIPIVMSSYINYAQNNPTETRAILPSLSAIFGVSLESPLPPPSIMGMTPWGEQDTLFHPAGRNDIDKAMDDIGLTPHFPVKTINGVKLTNEQYHDYIALSGSYAKKFLESAVTSADWGKMPTQFKTSLIKTVISGAQEQAQVSIMQSSQGTSNDIFQKSIEAARAKAQGETKE